MTSEGPFQPEIFYDSTSTLLTLPSLCKRSKLEVVLLGCFGNQLSAFRERKTPKSHGFNYTCQTSAISLTSLLRKCEFWLRCLFAEKEKKLFDKIIIFASCCTGGTEVWDLAKGSIRLTIWYPPPHQTTTCSLMPSAERRREGTGSH